MKAGTKLLIGRLIFLLVILCIWEYTVRSQMIDSFWLSMPSLILKKTFKFFVTGEIFSHLYATLSEAVVGLVVGSLGGIILGLFLAHFTFISKVIEPFIDFFYSIPRIALAPLFVLWFGLGLASKVVTIFVIVFFLLLVNTVAGIKSVNQTSIKALKTMGATKLQIMRIAIIPSTMAWIFAGLRLAIPNSVIGAVIAEYVGSTKGLGYIILFSSSSFDTTALMSAILVLACLSLTISRIIRYFERKVLRWQTSQVISG